MNLYLARSAGADVEVNFGPETRAALEVEALRFLRAGGTVPLREWALLDPCERDALAVAGDRLALIRAVATLGATLDPAGTIATLEQPEGHALLEAAVERIAARLTAGGPA